MAEIDTILVDGVNVVKSDLRNFLRKFRERLTADRTFYVRKDGDDSNDGLANTAGGAFLTIQHALNFVRDNIDANYHKVVVQVGAGTYSETLILGNVIGINEGGWPGKELCVRGDVTTPANVIISSGSGVCFTGVGVHTGWYIEGFKLSSTTAWVEADAGSRIYVGKNTGTGNPTYGVICIYKSFIEIVDNFTTDSTAMTYFIYADYNSVVLYVSGLTLTLTNTLVLAGAFVLSSSSSVVTIGNITFTGTATGPRYQIIDGAGVSTGSAVEAYLPGSVNGTVAREGWYNNIDRRFKCVSTTYSASTTGALAVTGAGFAPKFVDVKAVISGTQAWSAGSYDGSGNMCIESRGIASTDTLVPDLTHCAALLTGGSDLAQLVGASLDADGATFTKSIGSGSPTGTVTLICTFYR